MTTTTPVPTTVPTTRAARPDDAILLRRLFDEDRLDELVRSGVPAEVAGPLADLQHRSRAHAHAAYASTRDLVLEVDGTPVGRLLVADRPDGPHVVDVAVLVAHRRRGHARAALDVLLADADARGLPVTLHGAPDNPALNLYLDLGFVVAETTVPLLLRRPARRDLP